MQPFVHELNQCVLFRHLSAPALWELLAGVAYQVREYQRGEVIFSPHDPACTLGILLSGSVDVQKIFPSGRVITVNRRHAPDVIADASIFAAVDHYPSTISTCAPSRLFLIQREALLTLFQRDETMMAAFLTSVSNRVLALNHTIELFSLHSVAAKIAYFLCRERKKQGSCTISLKMTKKALAEHLNVSRTTLSRELKQMETQGLLTVEKRTITLHCSESLEELCGQ